MKIVIVTSLLRGGPIEQALIATRGIVKAGNEVLVIAAGDAVAERFEAVGARAELVPLRRQGDVAHAVRIWKLARGADVVHAHDRRSGLWMRLVPRPKRGAAIVYTVHGLPEPYLPPPLVGGPPSFGAVIRYRWLDALLCAHADAIVAPSRFVEAELVSRLGFPARKVVVVPNGVEVDRPSEGSGNIIGTLSLWEPVKGLDLFVDAVSVLAPKYPDWRFGMFGGGSQQAQIEAKIVACGLGARIERPGFVESHLALAELALLVQCSYLENAPMALMEAMACGVPVVTTAVGGVPEIADEGVARMVPAGDHLRLAQAIEAAMLDRMGTAARAKAALERIQERFSADNHVAATLDLYRRVTEGRPM